MSLEEYLRVYDLTIHRLHVCLGNLIHALLEFGDRLDAVGQDFDTLGGEMLNLLLHVHDAVSVPSILVRPHKHFEFTALEEVGQAQKFLQELLKVECALLQELDVT